jgi:hypothetical protein
LLEAAIEVIADIIPGITIPVDIFVCPDIGEITAI